MWNAKDDGFADLASHDTFADGPPHKTFGRLRADDPLHWTDWSQGKGFWSVTRYEDIMSMIGNTEVFSSAQGIRMEDQTPEEYLARRTFQETDGMDHRKVRMKVAKAFSAPVMNKFEGEIRRICQDILDDVLPRGTFDATKAIARELPMRMLGRILGLPEEDLPWLVEKGDALIANTDPDFTDNVLDKLDTDDFRLMPFNSPAGAELYTYAKKLMEAKAKDGDTDGILHLIMQPDEDGNVISQTEFRNFFCLMVAAGNDTTRYSIAAGIHALCHQPDLLAQMHAGGGVWASAANEIIRWATPTQHFRRTATQDFEMHGKTIRKGDKVLYWFTSANRDESIFDEPFKLDLNRAANRHLAFGQGGPHVCLGMWLARLEVRILFEELAGRIASIEAAGPSGFLRSNFICGIKELPISVQLRKTT